MTEQTTEHQNVFQAHEGGQPAQEPAVSPVIEKAPEAAPQTVPFIPKGEGILTFKKPHEFEGRQYHYVDLSGLENLTGNDLIEADKIFASEGGFSMMPEMTPVYTFAVAAMATKHPVDFFRNLPAKEAVKVKTKVINFLNN